ncbi:peptidase A24A prepilin type IV [Paenibacillus sp. FSL R7-269]|uniref:prepilin peptidase n=1 Tax=Paenibacillus sp. FSL R7-269 TaxID=1226755 RepID=UPI0003E1EDEB|nr:A24 family peptidase [Paenibacillus sp. FSL R7-269]ETT46881.1 peptidase A24A prepilin type IV [Paenibacillus sp. FSL R7-269]
MAIVNMLLTISLMMLCCWFSYTDITERRISNKLTYPAILSLLVLRIGFNPEYLWGLVPGAVLFLVFMISPRSLGAGDVKLVALLGLGLGLERAVGVLLLMCIFAFLYQGGRKLLSLETQSSLPLAPFLTLGLLGIIVAL